MGKSTISMVIFNSYFDITAWGSKLLKGNSTEPSGDMIEGAARRLSLRKKREVQIWPPADDHHRPLRIYLSHCFQL